MFIDRFRFEYPYPPKKFVGIEYNEMHLLKSLTYFEDAEKGKMPKMMKEISWNDVKKSINGVVDNYMNSFKED